jgi:hypothetical protein
VFVCLQQYLCSNIKSLLQHSDIQLYLDKQYFLFLFIYACKHDKVNIIKGLMAVKHFRDWFETVPVDDGVPCFVYVVRTKVSLNFIRVFIDNNIDPNVRNKYHLPLLFMACDNIELLKVLLLHPRLDVNILGNYCNSILCQQHMFDNDHDPILLSDPRFSVLNITYSYSRDETVFKHICMRKYNSNTIKLAIIKYVSQKYPTPTKAEDFDLDLDLDLKLDINSTGYTHKAKDLLSQYICNNNIIDQWKVDVDDPLSQIFTLVILLCDNYLTIKKEIAVEQNNMVRWFNIMTRLPMELQTVLCHTAFACGDKRSPVKGSLVTNQAKKLFAYYGST